MTIKVKLSSFEILQRSRTLGHGVRSKTSLEQVSKELLSGLVKERGPEKKMSARLLGVRVHNWVESGGQSSLLSYTGGSRKWECPVCGGSFPANVRSFNQHVDSCVERGTSHVLGEEEAAASMAPAPTESCPSNQPDDNKPALITPPRGVKRRSTEPVGESSSKRAPQSKGIIFFVTEKITFQLLKILCSHWAKPTLFLKVFFSYNRAKYFHVTSQAMSAQFILHLYLKHILLS